MLEDLGAGIIIKVNSEVLTNLLPVISSNSLEDFLNIQMTSMIISNFRTKALQSYHKEEFHDNMPDVLKPFVDRSYTLQEGTERKYHAERMLYINYLFNIIDKKPTQLKAFESYLSDFFAKHMIAEKKERRRSSNAVLQFNQLETNACHLYALLSLRRLGENKYILGIGNDGSLNMRGAKKPRTIEEEGQFYSAIHSHAIVFLNLNPKIVHELVKNEEKWANNPQRFEGIAQENSGEVGFQMLKVGQDNKYFHSSLPHEVLLKDKIRSMTVIDVPPNHIYFKTKFADASISIGAMGFPEDNSGQIMLSNSDFTSRLIMDNILNPKETAALCDLAGSIARDMFICEKKDKFYERCNGGGKKAQKRRKDKKVIWLPRFKVNLMGRRDGGIIREEVIRLSPAHVSGHPRRAENPSKEQLDLAKRLGVVLPPGHTYVKEYDRSGSEEFKRVYKSRSALSLLYGMT